MSLFTRRRPSPADSSFPQYESALHDDAVATADRSDTADAAVEDGALADVQFADVTFEELGVPADLLKVLQ